MVEFRRRVTGFGLLIALYLLIVYIVPKPDAVKQEGWRLFGIFVAAVAGLIVQPIPGGAIVLIAVAIAPILGGITLAQSLSGYADSTVWLVMAAFFISRALINTGLARRIARVCPHVRKNSLGICYSLSLSDMVLATIIPSAGARSGGVVMPIVRSIAELYGSRPGPTARLLGSFLMLGVYQCVCISAAMFFTGQASNPLVAKMAGVATGFQVTWASWFVAGLVPGLCSIAPAPWLVMKLYPPEIRRTPEAAAFAASELKAMGAMSTKEWILAAVFVSVCGMWITSDLHKFDITLTALLGSVSLLITGVLSWDDVKSEKAGWDIFVWYGGLLMLGKALNDTKVPSEFANAVAGAFGSLGGRCCLFARS